MHTLAAVVQDKWPLLIMWSVMLACASYCEKSLRLPNRGTFSLMLGGLALGVIHDGGGHPDGGNGGLQASGVCLLLAFILLLPFYARGLFPAGGVKLHAGFAACVGAFFAIPRGLLIVALSSFLLPVTVVAAGLLEVKANRLPASDPKKPPEIAIGYIASLIAIGSMLMVGFLM